MAKRIRPLGEITGDLEEVISEMIDKHELQKGEVLALVASYIDIHYPDAIEQYEDNTLPVYVYGHQDLLQKKLDGLCPVILKEVENEEVDPDPIHIPFHSICKPK